MQKTDPEFHCESEFQTVVPHSSFQVLFHHKYFDVAEWPELWMLKHEVKISRLGYK